MLRSSTVIPSSLERLSPYIIYQTPHITSKHHHLNVIIIIIIIIITIIIIIIESVTMSATNCSNVYEVMHVWHHRFLF